jgi:hypothetical protein
MLLLRLLSVAALAAMPLPAAGQAWAEAYDASDYARAADLLHEVVVDSVLRHAMEDPSPARHLAVLYARGLGVERDPVAACTLAQVARMAAEMSAHQFADAVLAYERLMTESDRFAREHCGLLTHDEQLTAGRALGCFAFGMPEQELVVAGQTVRVGRHGVSIVSPDSSVASSMDLLGCPMAVAGVRVTSLEPPPDAAPGVTARHFVEMFAWHRNLQERGHQPPYTLVWTAHEVRRRAVLPAVLFEVLGAAERWPGPGLPGDLDARLRLQMIRSGHVRWWIAGDPPRRGWMMLPEEPAR